MTTSGAYKYIRYMRDGSVKEVTAVIRSRSSTRKTERKSKKK